MHRFSSFAVATAVIAGCFVQSRVAFLLLAKHSNSRCSSSNRAFSLTSNAPIRQQTRICVSSDDFNAQRIGTNLVPNSMAFSPDNQSQLQPQLQSVELQPFASTPIATTPLRKLSDEQPQGSNSQRATGSRNFAFLVPVILLILQNSGLILFMRYSIVKANNKRYIISTAVLCSELIKFSMSSLLSVFKDVQGDTSKYMSLLYQECITKKQEFLRIIIPSILYAIQNNLQYVAVANLSAPVFQTMYQLKIVTTALFSVVLLKRKLLLHQWASIFTLFMGASAVQLSQQALAASSSVSGRGNNLTGLITVIISCFTSGFSGVYFEKTLKNKNATASIWLRNVQMSFFGILLGILGCLTTDKNKILELGFFYGYNNVVWTVILLQALGGLVVSMVVKHADNLMKGFATSVSIIISCGLSSLLFKDLRINEAFIAGSFIVVASTLAFGYTPPVAPAVFDSESSVNAEVA